MTEKKHGNTGSHGVQTCPCNLNHYRLFGNCKNEIGIFLVNLLIVFQTRDNANNSV